MPPGRSPPESTERSPLLRDEEQNGRPVQDEGLDGAQEASDVPLAEELSTKKLLAIMSAMWLGSFFAALGKYSVSLFVRFPQSDLIHQLQTPQLLLLSLVPYPRISILYPYCPGSPPATSSLTQHANLSAAS